LRGSFFINQSTLFNSNFSPADAAASKEADFAALKVHDAIFGGVNGEVTANGGTNAGAFGHAYLADQDFAGADFLAAAALNA